MKLFAGNDAISQYMREQSLVDKNADEIVEEQNWISNWANELDMYSSQFMDHQKGLSENVTDVETIAENVSKAGELTKPIGDKIRSYGSNPMTFVGINLVDNPRNVAHKIKKTSQFFANVGLDSLENLLILRQEIIDGVAQGLINTSFQIPGMTEPYKLDTGDAQQQLDEKKDFAEGGGDPYAEQRLPRLGEQNEVDKLLEPIGSFFLTMMAGGAPFKGMSTVGKGIVGGFPASYTMDLNDGNLATALKDILKEGGFKDLADYLSSKPENAEIGYERLQLRVKNLVEEGSINAIFMGLPIAFRMLKALGVKFLLGSGATVATTQEAEAMGLGTIFRGGLNLVDNISGGIKFDKDVTANNVRLHLKRLKELKEDGKAYPGGPKNERTVIKSTNPELPDFVVGNITPEDWVARTEALFKNNAQAINKASQWYTTVFSEFDKLAKGNEDELRKLGEAWLSAQQNETPANALSNVIHIFEQFKSGVPFEEVTGKGLPAANRIASSILYGKEITGGAGQKISDFIDSGYGKTTRSIMGNDPEGGFPFVVDVHTGRDTGLVDQELVNHLKRLGYEVPDNLIIDMGGGGIKGPQYENRAVFGQELTNHLNDINWLGRSDWNPTEAQAIGWMGLTDMYGGVAQGGDVETAFARNIGNIAMEVDPGEGSPWAAKYGESYRNLDDAKRIEINNKVTQKAIEQIAKEEGTSLPSIINGQGGWKQFQNPSTVFSGPITKATANRVAAKLGYLLNQTAVLVNHTKPLTKNPQNFTITIKTPNNEVRDQENLTSLMDALMKLDNTGLIAQGYHPVTVDGAAGINIVITKEDINALKKEGVIKSLKEGKEIIMDFVNNRIGKALDDLKFDAEAAISEAEPNFVGNDWTKEKDGGTYKSYFSGEGGSDATVRSGADIDSYGQELETFFRNLIEEAKSGKD
jgi:hypothetical protein